LLLICLCCSSRKKKWLQSILKMYESVGLDPNDCYISSNNAYPFLNKILIPIKSNQNDSDQYKIAYNFYLSQFLIRVDPHCSNHWHCENWQTNSRDSSHLETKFSITVGTMKCILALKGGSSSHHAFCQL
jgi:hypothetical protein